jgi:hypothetical protein
MLLSGHRLPNGVPRDILEMAHCEEVRTTLTRQMPEKLKQGNGTKPPRRRKPAPPKLPEKTKKLTLKAFRLAYEAHHPKSS